MPLGRERIASVRAYLPAASARPTSNAWEVGELASPMSRFPGFERRSSFQTGLDLVVVVVESSSGQTGIGVTTGGPPVCWIIERMLAPLLVGNAVAARAELWEKMYLSTLWYGRRGLPVFALSALDLALWDLFGKIVGEPVYALLGAGSNRVPVYATGPDAGYAQANGYRGAKLPVMHAPAEGRVGLQATVETLRQAREEVGADYPLMIDAWMSLDEQYALDLCRAAQDCRLTWIEEPLVPDDYLGMARLRAGLPDGVRLATGEHEATVEGFALLLRGECADVLQPDPLWCGGMSELIKIGALAREYAIPVVPHTSSVYGYHFTCGQNDWRAWDLCPLGEFYIRPQASPQTLFAGVLTGEVLPVGGSVQLSEAAGFGLELDPDAHLASVRWSTS